MRKPVLAFAICGAVLLVPLAVSAPGIPARGEEVVLAAGSPGPPADVAEPAADLGAEVEPDVAEVVEVDAEATVEAEAETGAIEYEAAFAGPSTTRKSKPRPRSAAKSSSTSSTAKARTAKPASGTTSATAAAKVAVAKAPPPPPPPPPAPSTPAPAPAAGGGDSDWDRLAQCESGNTNDPGAPYYGYWQFSAGTWSSMGEPGLPNEHSRAHQLVVAKRLQAARGWAPWPDCSRRLGLR